MNVLEDMIGVTFDRVYKLNDALFFEKDCEVGWRFMHHDDCCEHVFIEDIAGDLSDLVGSPILMAEAIDCDEGPLNEHEESYTWTFYKFATVKGYVTVRWYGSSNGYYSESVSVERV